MKLGTNILIDTINVQNPTFSHVSLMSRAQVKVTVKLCQIHNFAMHYRIFMKLGTNVLIDTMTKIMCRTQLSAMSV